MQGLACSIGAAHGCPCANSSSRCVHNPAYPGHSAAIINASAAAAALLAAVAVLVLVQLLSPNGEQIWSQQNVQSEVHFNIAAHGPGVYKLWYVLPP